jgi:hypothetical protein
MAEFQKMHELNEVCLLPNTFPAYYEAGRMKIQFGFSTESTGACR